MKLSKEECLETIYRAIDELNTTREDNDKIVQDNSTALYGPQSPMDSVDLVNLLLSIEETLEDDFDIHFTIANEKAMSLKNSPFRTVETLAAYIFESATE